MAESATVYASAFQTLAPQEKLAKYEQHLKDFSASSSFKPASPYREFPQFMKGKTTDKEEIAGAEAYARYFLSLPNWQEALKELSLGYVSEQTASHHCMRLMHAIGYIDARNADASFALGDYLRGQQLETREVMGIRSLMQAFGFGDSAFYEGKAKEYSASLVSTEEILRSTPKPTLISLLSPDNQERYAALTEPQKESLAANLETSYIDWMTPVDEGVRQGVLSSLAGSGISVDEGAKEAAIERRRKAFFDSGSAQRAFDEIISGLTGEGAGHGAGGSSGGSRVGGGAGSPGGPSPATVGTGGAGGSHTKFTVDEATGKIVELPRAGTSEYVWNYPTFSDTDAMPVPPGTIIYAFNGETHPYVLYPRTVSRMFGEYDPELVENSSLSNPKTYLERDADYFYWYWGVANNYSWDAGNQQFIRITDPKKEVNITNQYKDILSDQANLLKFVEYMMRGLPHSACAELERAQKRFDAAKAAGNENPLAVANFGGSTYLDIYRTAGDYYDVRGQKIGTFANESEAKSKRSVFVKVSDPLTGEELLVRNHYRLTINRTLSIMQPIYREYEKYQKLGLEEAIDETAKAVSIRTPEAGNREEIRAEIVAGLQESRKRGIPELLSLAHLSAGVSVGTDEQYAVFAKSVRDDFGQETLDKLEGAFGIMSGGKDVVKWLAENKSQFSDIEDFDELVRLAKELQYISIRVAPGSEKYEPPRRVAVMDAPKQLFIGMEALGEHEKQLFQNRDFSVTLKPFSFLEGGEKDYSDQKLKDVEIKCNITRNILKGREMQEVSEEVQIPLNSDGSATLKIPTDSVGRVRMSVSITHSTISSSAESSFDLYYKIVRSEELQLPRYDKGLSISGSWVEFKPSYPENANPNEQVGSAFRESSSGLALVYNKGQNNYYFAKEGEAACQVLITATSKQEEKETYLITDKGKKLGRYSGDGKIIAVSNINLDGFNANKGDEIGTYENSGKPIVPEKLEKVISIKLISKDIGGGVTAYSTEGRTGFRFKSLSDYDVSYGYNIYAYEDNSRGTIQWGPKNEF